MAFTQRYVRADAAGGGNGTTDTNSGVNGAWTITEAVTNAASGQCINVRQGAYNLANNTSQTFVNAGTTTAPIWWRGFNAVPGDLETDNTLAKPVITYSGTGRAIFSGAHQIFSGISFVSAASNPCGTGSQGTTQFRRCRFENTGSNAASRAFSVTNAGVRFFDCYFKATTSATSCWTCNVNAQMFGCVVLGGAIGIEVTGAGVVIINNTVVRGGQTGAGISLSTTGTFSIEAVTVSGAGTDGIAIPTVPGFGCIANCLLRSNLGFGINNSSGTNTNTVSRSNNAFYNNSSGQENGFGDSPAFSTVTESADPVSSVIDMTLVSTAGSKSAGLPQGFENESYSSKPDIGAVQTAASSVAGPLIGPARHIR